MYLLSISKIQDIFIFQILKTYTLFQINQVFSPPISFLKLKDARVLLTT